MKTKTNRAPKKRKRTPSASRHPVETGRKKGPLSFVAGALLLVGAGFGAYRAGEALSQRAWPNEGIVISVAQAGVDAVSKVGKERAKVKGVGGSVFSEGDAPTVIGDIPAGWRVETSPDVKAKFGPQPVPGGEDITFVVPVYTLVPEERRPGVYVMEPGRAADGQDGGGTLGGVLERMRNEAAAIGGALDTLSDSLAGLEKMAPEFLEGDPVEEAEDQAQ